MRKTAIKGKVRNNSTSVNLGKIPRLLLRHRKLGKIIKLMKIKTSRKGLFQYDNKNMHVEIG